MTYYLRYETSYSLSIYIQNDDQILFVRIYDEKHAKLHHQWFMHHACIYLCKEKP